MKKVKQGGQGNAQQDQQGKSAAHDLAGPLDISTSPGNGAQRRAAGAAEIGKSGNDIGYRHYQANAGESISPDPLNVSDKGPVHYIVEDHRELRHC